MFRGTVRLGHGLGAWLPALGVPAPFCEYFIFTSGAHATSTLSGLPTPYYRSPINADGLQNRIAVDALGVPYYSPSHPR